MENKNLCKCGCGTLVTKNYKKGHGRKGKTNSPEHNAALSVANKGKKRGKAWNSGIKGIVHHTQETKDKISKIAKEKGFGKWMSGKEMSKESIDKILQTRISNGSNYCKEETKQKISAANKGTNNGMFGKTHSSEVIEKISEASLRNWNTDGYAEKIERNIEACRRGAMNAAKSFKNKGYCDTKPELEMEQILIELGVEFEKQYPIEDIVHIYCCDFYLPKYNLVLEVDGKHWHNYPNLRELDIIRNMELKEQNYNLMRFWENEFNLDTVKMKLEEINKWV